MTYTPRPGFPIGTHVRVVDYALPGTGRNGKEGIVVVPDTSDRYYVHVDHGNGNGPTWPYEPQELEVIDPPTTAATLRSRADELTAKAEANREELRGLQERVNDLDREAWRLNGLAAQYRAVADDLEAQK